MKFLEVVEFQEKKVPVHENSHENDRCKVLSHNLDEISHCCEFFSQEQCLEIRKKNKRNVQKKESTKKKTKEGQIGVT
jgi:hypothetical protein